MLINYFVLIIIAIIIIIDDNDILCLLQEEYAILLGCVQTQDHHQFIIIQEFEKIEYNGELVTNEFDCPLLTLTLNVKFVSPLCVDCCVSIVHQCTTCGFTQHTSPQYIERELVSSSAPSLSYKHDWSNKLFTVNIYCMQ